MYSVHQFFARRRISGASLVEQLRDFRFVAVDID
jgi:hypothetical protein